MIASATRNWSADARPGDAVLDHELADLPHAPQPPLDVTGAARVEVAHREREQLARQEIEAVAIDPHRESTEHVALDDGGEDGGQQGAKHAHHDQREQPDVVLGDHVVDHELAEHRNHHLGGRGDEPEPEHDDERPPVRAEEVEQPPKLGLLVGFLLEGFGGTEEGGVAGPLLLELGALHAPPAARRIRHPNVVVTHLVENEPVVVVPMDDGRQRHLAEATLGRFDRPCHEAELLSAVRQAKQAGSVGGGEDGLPDSRQRHLPTQVTAHDRQRRGAAVHFVHLVDVGEATGRVERRGVPVELGRLVRQPVGDLSEPRGRTLRDDVDIVEIG